MEAGETCAFASWFYALGRLGSEIYHEAVKPSELHRYVVLALPQKDYVLSAILLGVISEYLRPLDFKIDDENTISVENIVKGMKITGQVNENKFVARVLDVRKPSNKIPGAITLEVNGKQKTYGSKFMRNLRLVSELSEDNFGYFPDQEQTRTSYWPISSSLGQLDTRFFTRPIVQILGSKVSIEEEWSKAILWNSNSGVKYGTFSQVSCPYDEKSPPPYFTFLTTQTKEMISPDAQEFKIDILSSFSAIKARLDRPVSSFSLILLGRNDGRSRSMGSLLESRYASSQIYEPFFESIHDLPSVELLSFGLSKS